MDNYFIPSDSFLIFLRYHALKDAKERENKAKYFNFFFNELYKNFLKTNTTSKFLHSDGHRYLK